jgi:hypothetical protein
MPIMATVTAAKAAMGFMLCRTVLADSNTVKVAAAESMIKLAPTARFLRFICRASPMFRAGLALMLSVGTACSEISTANKMQNMKGKNKIN